LYSGVYEPKSQQCLIRYVRLQTCQNFFKLVAQEALFFRRVTCEQDEVSLEHSMIGSVYFWTVLKDLVLSQVNATFTSHDNHTCIEMAKLKWSNQEDQDSISWKWLKLAPCVQYEHCTTEQSLFRYGTVDGRVCALNQSADILGNNSGWEQSTSKSDPPAREGAWGRGRCFLDLANEWHQWSPIWGHRRTSREWAIQKTLEREK